MNSVLTPLLSKKIPETSESIREFLFAEKLLFLVTQQFELLLPLVLGDLLTPFFLQVTHFFTF